VPVMIGSARKKGDCWVRLRLGYRTIQQGRQRIVLYIMPIRKVSPDGLGSEVEAVKSHTLELEEVSRSYESKEKQMYSCQPILDGMKVSPSFSNRYLPQILEPVLVRVASVWYWR
jgi:hypothetical protein